MMAVSAVYRCRYCCYVHTKEALKAGVCQEEIESLLSGSVNDCPQEEAVALLYAQHWAESGADPAPEATQRLIETYGDDKTEAINLTLRMIKLGNLMGNTWDYFLYHISFGRWGVPKRAI